MSDEVRKKHGRDGGDKATVFMFTTLVWTKCSL